MIRTLLVAAWVILSGSALADHVTHKNSKGIYYEVHKNSDGRHSFYLVPESAGTWEGLVGTCYAYRDGKIVFMVEGITNNSKMTAAWLERKVPGSFQAFCVSVNLDLVDRIDLIWTRVGPPRSLKKPMITYWTTDLLWLLEEAPKEGRFRDLTTKANKAREDKRPGG